MERRRRRRLVDYCNLLLVSYCLRRSRLQIPNTPHYDCTALGTSLWLRIIYPDTPTLTSHRLDRDHQVEQRASVRALARPRLEIAFSRTRKTSLTSPLGHYRLLSRLYCIHCGRFVRSSAGPRFRRELVQDTRRNPRPAEQCLTVHARLTSNYSVPALQSTTAKAIRSITKA